MRNIGIVVTAQASRDLPMALNPDEVSEVAWVPIAELHQQVAADPSRFTPWLRIYLAEHAGRIFDTPE